jgi:hypothetical protein
MRIADWHAAGCAGGCPCALALAVATAVDGGAGEPVVLVDPVTVPPAVRHCCSSASASGMRPRLRIARAAAHTASSPIDAVAAGVAVPAGAVDAVGVDDAGWLV